jgi:hypothetical protein
MRMASSSRGALGGRGAPGGCGLESGETRTSMPFNDTGLVPICRHVVSDLIGHQRHVIKPTKQLGGTTLQSWIIFPMETLVPILWRTSTSSAPGLRHLAVRNPDGGFALVMTNPGEGRDLRIVYAGQQLCFSLPRNAVATLAW